MVRGAVGRFDSAGRSDSDDQVGDQFVALADDQIARRLDDRAQHVLHPRIVARQPADRCARLA